MKERHSRKKNGVWLMVFILGVSLSAAGCEVNEKFRKTVHLLKPLESNKHFEAGTHNGSIRASRNEIGGCEVTATITGRGPTVQDAEKVTDHIQIKLEYSGDRLVAVVDKPEWLEQRYFSIDYKIQLPATTSLDFSAHNGSIEVTTPGELSAELNASTHNGSIEVFQPVTVTGRVDKTNFRGKMGTGNGLLYLRAHNGAITVR